MKSNSSVVAALVATGALLTSACGTEPSAGQTIPSEQTTPTEEATTDPAIQRATAAFPETLPEGVQWPRTGIDLTDPAVNPDQGHIVGYPEMQDDFIAGYWLCSWMDVYLQAVDEQDLQKRNKAVANIARYPSLPVSQKYLSNPEDFDTMITAPARRGDPTMVREFYESSCSIYRDNQPAGSTS